MIRGFHWLDLSAGPQGANSGPCAPNYFNLDLTVQIARASRAS